MEVIHNKGGVKVTFKGGENRPPLIHPSHGGPHEPDLTGNRYAHLSSEELNKFWADNSSKETK